jgi:hypothetical protein
MQELQAVEARHVKVRDENLGRRLLQERERFLAVRGGRDLEALLSE